MRWPCTVAPWCRCAAAIRVSRYRGGARYSSSPGFGASSRTVWRSNGPPVIGAPVGRRKRTRSRRLQTPQRTTSRHDPAICPARSRPILQPLQRFSYFGFPFGTLALPVDPGESQRLAELRHGPRGHPAHARYAAGQMDHARLCGGHGRRGVTHGAPWQGIGLAGRRACGRRCRRVRV